MLKHRLATAALLIPLIFYILFAASPAVFRFAIAVIVFLAAWEWPTLMGKPRLIIRVGYVAFLLAILFITSLMPLTLVLSFAVGCWVILTLWVLQYPNKQAQWNKAWQVGLLGAFIILPLYPAFNYMRSLTHANELIAILLLLIWGADTSAYFAGRRFGKNKLIPAVSPNKSWQGFYAAMVSSFLVAIIAIIWLNDIFVKQHFGFLCLAVITTLASVMGDLVESMFKRAQGVKDSGKILPGHGGILDRIDSLTAAAPLYTLGLIILGIN